MHPLLDLPSTGATIDELAVHANTALASMGVHVDDGRASDRIDSRTVRFYQTIGLLPKPEYDGRRALYSLTHLLRLVVAKRLQAEGHSLAQIQGTLPGRSDAQLWKALEALAANDQTIDSPAPAPAPATLVKGKRMTPAGTWDSTVRYANLHANAGDHASAHTAPPRELRAVELAPGVTLIIDDAATHAAAAANAASLAAFEPAALAAAITHALRNTVNN